jgi:hypothetical protein
MFIVEPCCCVLTVLELVEEAGCQACEQHSLQVREVVVVEEVGCQACENSLQVRECVEEVRSPGRGPVAATEL